MYGLVLLGFVLGVCSTFMIFFMLFNETKTKYVVVFHNEFQKNQVRIQIIKAPTIDKAFEKFYKKQPDTCRVLEIHLLEKFGLMIHEVYNKYEKIN